MIDWRSINMGCGINMGWPTDFKEAGWVQSMCTEPTPNAKKIPHGVIVGMPAGRDGSKRSGSNEEGNTNGQDHVLQRVGSKRMGMDE